MSGLSCKQIVCLEVLKAKIRAVEKVDRHEIFTEDQYKEVVRCSENAIAGLDEVLAEFTQT